MMSCVDDDASKALAAVCTSNQELVRKAVITAFFYSRTKIAGLMKTIRSKCCKKTKAARMRMKINSRGDENDR